LELSQKYQKTPAQIILSWHINHNGNWVIPKTTNLERMQEYIQSQTFILDKDDYLKIDKINTNLRVLDPSEEFDFENIFA
jgi:diketogulonate reductase-like aldo/keto reductase